MKIINQTPLTLSIIEKGQPNQVPNLEPFKQFPDAQGLSANTTWIIKDAYSNSPIMEVAAKDTDPDCKVTAAVMKSLQGLQKVTVNFKNDTDLTLEAFWVNYNGELVSFGTCEPDKTVGWDSYATHVWLFQTLFTQELVGLFIAGQDKTQNFTLKNDFLRRQRQQKAQLALTPWKVGNEHKPLLLVGARRNGPPVSARDYIHISEHRNLAGQQFNTVESQVTRSVKIAGVKLIWSTRDNNYGLMSYQGEDVLDLQALEMYADQVIVRSPLWFPRTNVTIYARELIFESDGAIRTDPVPFKAPAFSAKKTEDGHPAETDAAGELTYKTADGKHGEQAGDIDVRHVKSIRVPVSQGGQTIPRFLCRGSQGQKGEKGGLRKYKPNGAFQPPADKGKNLNAVTQTMIQQHIATLYPDVAYMNRINYWLWPGEVSWPDRMTMPKPVNWSVSSGDNKLDEKSDANKTNGIVHMKIVGYNDLPFTTQVILSFLPSQRFDRSITALALAFADQAQYGEGEKFKSWVDDTRLRPGDGEDAYASGKSGNGGKGGTVYLPDTIRPFPADPRTLCDVTGGKTGPKSDDIQGGAPGSPYPAYWLEVWLLSFPRGLSRRIPEMRLDVVSAKAGSDAKGSTGASGANGEVELITPPSGTDWIHPNALEAVLACARDAYRDGRRDEARELLDPYYAALRKDTPPKFLSQWVEIDSMRTNMRNNLDYYSHAPGWLPRLNVTTSFKLWSTERQVALQILYYTQKLLGEWEQLEDQQETLNQTATALKKELDAITTALPKAYEELQNAKKTMDQVQEAFRAKEADVESLRKLASSKAKNKVKEQRIFSNVLKLVGGLAKVVPVGQPGLGMAGSVLDLAGDFDWNKENVFQGNCEIFTKLGEQTSKFLEKNNDLFIKRAGASSRGQQEQAQQSLEELTKEATGSSDALDEVIAKKNKQLETEWDTTRGPLVSELRGKINAANDNIETLKDARKKAEEEGNRDAFQAALNVASEKLAVRLKTKYYNELAKLQGEKQQTFLTETTKINAQFAKAKETEEEVEKHKKAADTREEKCGQLLNNLSGLGEGIASIGTSIMGLCAPISDHDPEVERLMEGILESEFKDEYKLLLDQVTALNKQKQVAVAAFCTCQQLITQSCATLSRNLSELNALSDQRQSLDGVLDASVQQYVAGMQKRQHERLLWYQYHFIKAAQYDLLTDVPDDFYKLDRWVKKLQEFEKGKKQESGTEKKRFLDEEDFKQVDEVVFKSSLQELVRKIVADRQSRARESTNFYECALTDDECKTLGERGEVTFNLINDLGQGSFGEVKFRIIDIHLEEFDFTSGDEHLSVDIEFRHSGESVLRDGKGQYYRFRCADDDDPISWGFVFNQADKDQPNKGISKDTELEEPDELFAAMVQSMGANAGKFREYWPSYFSDLTLSVNRKKNQDERLRGIKDIKKVTFKVQYARGG